MRVLIALIVTVVLTSAQDLPQGTSDLFAGSGNCAICHAPGGPNPGALVDQEGNDVSPATLWRSSMMAQAAKDPLWQAKVQAEIAAHPHLQELIEDKCTTCHAPMGRTQYIYDGNSDYSFEAMLPDPLAMDGVSCAACHQIQNQGLEDGSSFSGHFVINDERRIFGPHQNPVVGPMQNMLNYTPEFSEHTQKSEMCATCHTLFTPYLNDAGEIAGEAPEQVPYLEWLNSDYPAQGIECQTCHMPALEQSIAIANRPPWLTARNPLHPHEMVGGNVFMLRLMKQFRNELGVTATEEQMDQSISRTLDMLSNRTVELDLESSWVADSLLLALSIQNLSGHKFPTAYPSRRAWIELEVLDQLGTSVFHSGAWNDLGEIIGIDTIYEPHHNHISDPEQIQIYENIPQDLNGERTFTLLRIAGYLKDNRLPPTGYRMDGPAGDSTSIEGLANMDPDFNREAGVEGSGSDQVIYHIGNLNPSETYTIRAAMQFQSVSPRFVNDLFAYDIPEVTQFRSYYEALDPAPVTISEIAATTNPSSTIKPNPSLPSRMGLTAYPNPFNPETTIRLNVTVAGEAEILIYRVTGELVEKLELGYLYPGDYYNIWRPTAGESHSSGLYLAKLNLMKSGKQIQATQYLKMVYLK